jgi:formate/nitrite transporter FocA (FNT family)
MPLPSIRREIREDNSSSQQDLSRPTANQIFDQVAENARGELGRKTLPLAISGVAGGLLMGLTGLSVSILFSVMGHGPAGELTAFFFYPLGFMVVILGRSQLFTENTLYPIALMLAERRHYLSTARLWATVFPANIAGALLFAWLSW